MCCWATSSIQPRGRIYLIKEMLEHDAPATPEVVKHIDRCLSCLACMTTCPSGVHYMHLVDHARVHIERTYRRPLLDRMLRAVLAAVLPDNRRFRAGADAGPPGEAARAAAGARRAQAARRDAAARPGAAAGAGDAAGRVFPAEGSRKGRVALMAGCVTPVIGPSINEAADPRADPARYRGGAAARVRAAAAASSTTWAASTMRSPPSAATSTPGSPRPTARGSTPSSSPPRAAAPRSRTTASCCGPTRPMPARPRASPRWPRTSASISHGWTCGRRPTCAGLVAAYHGACSLQHGQKITREPKELLSKTGFVVKDVPEGHLCCGSAGTYNILAGGHREEVARAQGREYREGQA